MISDPVETPFGYHLIQVTDRKEGKEPDFEQNKPYIYNAYATELQKEVVAAEKGIAADAEDLVVAEAATDDGDVEGATAQVVDQVRGVAVVLDPGVIDGGGSRFVEQLGDVVAGQFTGLARGLDLFVVEVGRHGDDGAVEQEAGVVQGARQHVPQ